ncbi:MAG: hypothetical protein BGO00_06115 [Alphaproteobacteria bacterium 62-8]|nr:MAG: hypothetical protein BGO00_06115 [Alphaproteobacteria bacterium 62-8]
MHKKSTMPRNFVSERTYIGRHSDHSEVGGNLRKLRLRNFFIRQNLYSRTLEELCDFCFIQIAFMEFEMLQFVPDRRFLADTQATRPSNNDLDIGR